MRIFLISLLLPALWLHGGNGLDWLASKQDGGLWRNGGRPDYVCTLLTLGLLERSGDASYEREVKSCRDALAMEVGEGLYPTLARCVVASGGYGDLSPYIADGFSNETGAFPDLLCTLWCCHLLSFKAGVPEEWLLKSRDFIYSERIGDAQWGLSGEANARLALFALLNLLKLDESLSADALDMVLDYHAQDNVELSLQLGIMCACGEWERALELRHVLLDARNENGSWPENSGGEGDLLTTCLAMEALEAFSVSQARSDIDLDVPLDAVVQGNGEMSFLLFNNGNDASLPFDVEVEFYAGASLLKSIQHAVARLDGRHALRFEEEVPEGADLSVIKADVKGVSGDDDWSNNACHVPFSENASHGIVLAPLLAAGRNDTHPLFLGGGMGVMLTGAIMHHGNCNDGDLTWELLDDGEILCEGIIAGLISVEWFPAEGRHNLNLYVQCGGVQRACAASFEVVYDAAVLHVFAMDAQSLSPSNVFGAREYVVLQALSSYADSEVEVRVYSPQGELLGNAAKDPAHEGYWQWHTGNARPGNYRAEALFRKGTIVLARAEQSFEIQPTFRISDLKIESPDFKGSLYQRQEWAAPLIFSWNCVSNVQKDVHFAWHVEMPSSEICEFVSGGISAIADAGSFAQNTEVPGGIKGSFAEYGLHKLHAKLTCGEESVETVLPFEVRKRPVISIGSTVSPTCIDTGANMVRTTITLEGDAVDERGEPASFIVDDEPVTMRGNTVAVRLRDVSDAQGKLVLEGALLCSVPYGKLAGGVFLAEEGREQGDLRRYQVVNGMVELEYSADCEAGSEEEEERPLPIYISVRKQGNLELIGSIGIFILKGRK